MRKPITFITRLRLDAALYEPAPPRRPGQIGRPRLKGERLPNLSVVAEDPSTVWKPTTIANWYGSGERTVEIASETAVWYSTGLFAVPLRWVLIRDPEGEFKTQALLCTDLEADPEQIVSLVCDALAAGGDLPGGAQAPGIRDAEAVVGFGDPENHTGAVGAVLADHPVRSPARWRRRHGVPSGERRGTDKPHPTFADALALVRKELWAKRRLFTGRLRQTDTVKVPRAFVERLTDAVCYAA